MKRLCCGVLLTSLTWLAAIQPTTVLAEAETRRISNEAQVRASPEGQAFWAAYQQKNVPEMMKSAQALVEAFPNEAFAHACAGDAYAEAGLKKDALASYQHALELDPKSYEAEWKIGSWYDNAGDPTNALAHFERAVKIKPESPGIWALIGFAHYRMSNFRDAATALTQAVKLDTTDSGSWLFLGSALAQVGDADAAKAAYLTYYKLNPKLAQKDWDDFLEKQRKAHLIGLREIIVPLREGVDELVRRNRANADLMTGQGSMSQELRQMSRVDEYLKTGNDMVLRGDYEGAIKAYQEAMLNDSVPYAGLHAVIGRCYGVLGKYAEAVEALRLAHTENPKNCSTSFVLCSSLVEAARFAEARKAIEEQMVDINGTPCKEGIISAIKTGLPQLEAASEVRHKNLGASPGKLSTLHEKLIRAETE